MWHCQAFYPSVNFEQVNKQTSFTILLYNRIPSSKHLNKRRTRSQWFPPAHLVQNLPKLHIILFLRFCSVAKSTRGLIYWMKWISLFNNTSDVRLQRHHLPTPSICIRYSCALFQYYSSGEIEGASTSYSSRTFLYFSLFLLIFNGFNFRLLKCESRCEGVENTLFEYILNFILVQ